MPKVEIKYSTQKCLSLYIPADGTHLTFSYPIYMNICMWHVNNVLYNWTAKIFWNFFRCLVILCQGKVSSLILLIFTGLPYETNLVAERMSKCFGVKIIIYEHCICFMVKTLQNLKVIIHCTYIFELSTLVAEIQRGHNL